MSEKELVRVNNNFQSTFSHQCCVVIGCDMPKCSDACRVVRCPYYLLE